VKEQVSQLYTARFGAIPDRIYFSPGRINLIGEHIDYNGGHVLPAAISLGIWGAVKDRQDKVIRIYAGSFDEEVVLLADQPAELSALPSWGKYIAGMLHLSAMRTGHVKGADIYLYSTLPMGAGLSSSAALECLAGYIFAGDFYKDHLKELALDAREAEHVYAGVQCGIMDQYAVAFGKKDHAILLNCNEITHEYIPLELGDHALLIINSNKPRKLAESRYNERREECEAALEAINRMVPAEYLCSANQLALAYIEDDVLYARAKHAISEQLRVEAAVYALENNLLENFGQLLTASHQSLAVDFEVSCPELDALVHFATHHPACLGARMIGGGFGGCCLALVEKAQVHQFSDYVSRKYATKTGLQCDIYPVEIAGGVGEV